MVFFLKGQEAPSEKNSMKGERTSVTTEKAIEMIGVSKHFGGIQALKNVSFSVKKGSVHALVGENGAGKSTLMKILSGVYKKDQGRTILDDKDVEINDYSHSQALGIAFVPQELALVQYFSVAENIFLGREPRQAGKTLIDWKGLYKDTEKLLEELNINLNPKTKVRDLSVSDQQMVVIARILSQDAKVIIMDEPTARLGHHEIIKLLDYIRYLKAKGNTIIYISHRLEEIFEICDSVTVLRDGEAVSTKEVKDVTKDELIKLMVNRDVKSGQILYGDRKLAGEVLQVKNLTRTGVVRDISFSVRAGEILGIFGLVGSGRTETIRAMLGIDPRHGGTILLEGREVNFRNIRDSIKAGLVLVPEERRNQGVILSLSIRSNVTLGDLKKYGRFGILDQRKEKQAVTELVDRLRVRRSSIEQKVGDLSGGNQQKVVLSKWMANEVKVFLLDEPTRGIDVGAKSEIYQLIEKIASEGTAVVIISSEIPEIQSICDRVIIMKEGQITAELNRDQLQSAETILKYAIGT